MTIAHPKRGVLVASAIAVLTLLATLFVAPPASAAGAGTLSGTVYLGTFQLKAKAGEVLVSLVKQNGTALEPVVGVSATTDATGKYSFTGLDQGRYAPIFTYAGTGSYQLRWAPPGTVLVGQTFDAVIPRLMQLAGRVSIDTEGNYAGAGQVRVIAKSSETEFTTYTDAQGRYSFGAVLPNHVQHQISFEYLGPDEYYPLWYFTGSGSVGSWTSSGVSGWLTYDQLDANVVIGGTGPRVSGTLRTSSGAPAAGVEVELYQRPFEVDDPSQFIFVRSTVTNASGYYSFRGLPNTYAGWAVAWGQNPDDGLAVGSSPDGTGFRFGRVYYGDAAANSVAGADGVVYEESAVGATLSWTPQFAADLSDEGWGEVLVTLWWFDAATGTWPGLTFDSLYASHSSTALGDLPPGLYRIQMTYSGEVPVAPGAAPMMEFAVAEGQHVNIPFKLTPAGGSFIPENSVSPTVSGAPAVGSAWTASPGTWTPGAALAVYWLRCAQAITSAFTTVPSGCSAIPGATGTTYTPTAADAGKFLTVQVAGSFGTVFTLAGAISTTPIQSALPVNTVAPSVSGSAAVGSTWTAEKGTWTAPSTPTFGIYWLRCAQPVASSFTTVPSGCAAIPGATGATYVSTPADGGKYLTVQVAANGGGGFTLSGALTTVATTITTPTNTAPPTVSGSSTVGSAWTATAGTWTGVTSTAIYWVRCSASIAAVFTTLPAGCSAIPGATGTTYTSTAADAGKYLTVQVAGNGATGFALAGALNSTAIVSTAPKNSAPPTVSGSASVGSTWMATAGTWTGVSSTAVYWIRCAAPITAVFTTLPAGCSAIPGATGLTYTATASDGGKFLTVQVAGNGASGFALAGALNSTAIESTAPTNTAAPTVSGSSAVGSTWTATAGNWTGVTSTPVYWIRCAAPITAGFTTLPAGCSAIPGATGLNYVSTVADGGKYLTVQVAGNGANGFALAGALNSTAIVSTAPANAVPPTVSGSSAVGSTWTATAGTWTGTISTAVYWVRCSFLVAANYTTLPASCSAIPGATGLTYVATAADAGKYLSVQVAGNGASGFALSGAINATAIDGVAFVAPANTALPTVSGAAPVGSAWTATTGTWVGVNSTAVYWLRCSAPITSGFTTVPAGCSVIPGAVGTSYTSTSADAGKYLTVQVGGNGASSFALAGALNSLATG